MDTKEHHMWCNRFGTVTEGICLQCERLNREYPPLGHLDYTEEIRHYFPDAEVIPQNCSKTS